MYHSYPRSPVHLYRLSRTEFARRHVCIYVCMVITYSNSKDRPGKVANLACGQLNRKKIYIYLSSFAPEKLVPRDGFDSPVPCQPGHPHTQTESGAYLRHSSRFPRRRPFTYLNRHTPSGQSRVHRVTQLRIAGTGPVNPATGLPLLYHDPVYMRLSFPHPPLV